MGVNVSRPYGYLPWLVAGIFWATGKASRAQFQPLDSLVLARWGIWLEKYLTGLCAMVSGGSDPLIVKQCVQHL